MFLYSISLICSIDYLLSKNDRLPTEELFGRYSLMSLMRIDSIYFLFHTLARFTIYEIFFRYYLKFNWFILFHVKFRSRKEEMDCSGNFITVKRLSILISFLFKSKHVRLFRFSLTTKFSN